MCFRIFSGYGWIGNAVAIKVLKSCESKNNVAVSIQLYAIKR
jgi:hypothetical protein